MSFFGIDGSRHLIQVRGDPVDVSDDLFQFVFGRQGGRVVVADFHHAPPHKIAFRLEVKFLRDASDTGQLIVGKTDGKWLGILSSRHA